MTAQESPTSHPIETLDLDRWEAEMPQELQGLAVERLESGSVLFCPKLRFAVDSEERRVLDHVKGRRKNVTMVPGDRGPRGLDAPRADSEIVQAVLERFSAQSEALVRALFPGYGSLLISGRMSYRPAEVSDRSIADERYDDRLLHVDAFPSQPTRGARILRVFSNVNSHGEGRIWRVGEPFERAAGRFARELSPPVPFWLALRGAFKPPQRRRNAYDHLMLQLHDRLKLTSGYQAEAPRTEFAFPPDSSWIVFTDQVLHAALSGRQMLEKTFYIPVAAQRWPERSPLRVLERLTRRRLAQADGRDVSAVLQTQ